MIIIIEWNTRDVSAKGVHLGCVKTIQYKRNIEAPAAINLKMLACVENPCLAENRVLKLCFFF